MMRKKFILFIFLCSIIIFSNPLYVLGSSNNYLNNNKSNMPYINEDWLKYEALSSDEKALYEAIPPQYVVKYVDKSSQTKYSINNLVKSSNIPLYFNLNNVNGNNYLTKARDQGTLGLCWSFAAISSIESNMLLKGLSSINSPVTFSERQNDYILTNNVGYMNGNNFVSYNPYSINKNLGDGGNFQMASLYYSSVITPMEAKGEFSEYNLELTNKSISSVIDSQKIKYFVSDYVHFPTIDVFTATTIEKNSYRNQIKNHIMNYGSVYVGTIAPDTGYSGSCSITMNDDITLIDWQSSCGSGYPNGYHAMSIIGWDDNYSYSYCKNGNNAYQASNCQSNETLVTGSGAWILKNSWGESIEYPYLTFTSDFLEMGGIIKVSEKDFDNIYDEVKGDTLVTTLSNTKIYTYNKLVDNDEILKKISFKHISQGNTFGVYLSSDGSNNYTLIKTVTPELPGLTTIDVDNILLTSNKFSIKIIGDSMMPISIYAYTQDKVISTVPNIEVGISSVPVNMSINGEIKRGFKVGIISNNIKTGDNLSFQIYDASNNIVSINNSNSLFTNVHDDYVVNDRSSSYFTINNSVSPSSIYYLKTIYKDNVINTIAFSEAGIINVNSITLNKETLTLNKGTSETLSVTFNPSNASNKEVTWTSSDSSVASVSSGTITALKRGSTIITATSFDGMKTDTCTVTVLEPNITITSNTIAGNITGDANKIYNGYGGVITNVINTQDLIGDLEVTITNTSDIDVTDKFSIEGVSIVNNTSTITITLLEETVIDSGEYTVSISKDQATTRVYTFTINNPVYIENIIANNITVYLEKSMPLSFSITPSNATIKDVSYTSGNENILVINENGVVSGVKRGSTTITISALDGSNITKTINVSVETIGLTCSYSIGENNIYNVNNNTLKSQFVTNISYNGTGAVSVLDKNNNEIENGVIATAMKYKLVISNQDFIYDIVVKGDTDGDGYSTAGDAYDIILHSIAKKSLYGPYLQAAYIDDDDFVTAGDAYDIILYSIGRKDGL